MLNVDYKKQIGSVEAMTSKGDFVKCEIYQANCLFAIVYEKSVLFGFFSDLEHLKRCLGLRKGYDNICQDMYKNFTFYDTTTTYGTTTKTIVSNLQKANIEAKIVKR